MPYWCSDWLIGYHLKFLKLRTWTVTLLLSPAFQLSVKWTVFLSHLYWAVHGNKDIVNVTWEERVSQKSGIPIDHFVWVLCEAEMKKGMLTCGVVVRQNVGNSIQALGGAPFYHAFHCVGQYNRSRYIGTLNHKLS